MFIFSQGDLSLDHIFFAVKTTKKYHDSRGTFDKLWIFVGGGVTVKVTRHFNKT